MPRRANDPDLLRAQAQGGRDGENAYKQAQSQLTNQRQMAVQRAMQEAALRGAPQGAVAQLQGRVSMPYNRAIRSVTESGANFSADMAAREGRMDDYNQAVLAARQLIPVQIQEALAPIQAQNRFQLQSLRQEGANTVAQIEAQTAMQQAQIAAQMRLERLRMRQDRQQQRAANTAEAQTLDQSELASALVSGAQEHVGGAVGEAEGLVGQRVGDAQRDALNRVGQPSPEAAQAYYYQVTHPQPGAPATLAPGQASNIYGGAGPEAALELLAQRRAATANQVRPNEANTPAAPSTGDGSFLSRLFGGIPGAMGLPQQHQPTQLEQRAQGAYDQVVQNPEVRLPQGGFLGIEEGAQIDPLVGYAMQQSGRSQVGRPGQIAEMLGGYPQGGPGGAVNPVARDAFEQAMLMAGQGLADQGYDVTGPGLQAAIQGAGTSIYQPGDTLYDVEQARQGEPSARDQAFDIAEQQRQAAIDAAQTAQDAEAQQGDFAEVDKQAREDAAKDQILRATGVPYSSDMGPAETAAVAVSSPGFKAAITVLNDAVASGEYGSFIDIDDAIDQLGIQGLNPYERQLLKAIYG